MNEIPEIKLGTVLFSLAEPAAGHEREYNRWYERDHFFAGCMVGANYFSGRRWIATKPLKALRFPAETPIARDVRLGSFLHLYWILDGSYREMLRWSLDQVAQLARQKRMEPPRESISSNYYRYVWGAFRDVDGVPAELALEHPYAGVGVTMIDRAEGVDDAALAGWLKDRLPAALAGTPVAMSLCLKPQPLPDDAPAYVPRPDPRILEGRYLLLSFLEQDPVSVWNGFAEGLDRALSDSGLGQTAFSAPFIPTLPGTDRYIDEI
ncbi:MAG TPA: hypothetical protein VL899_17055 [Alphaproteobacteria bacterium]|nr:hypothetical protein [Alphaproteobacteria bacterium]